MTTQNDAQRPLPEMMAELETAIRAHDHERATQLEQIILQRLATDAAENATLERRVRALMQELQQAEASDIQLKSFDPFDLERSALEDKVYPVWFGTNRKPDSQGGGFTGERNDRITRGRVEVFVPKSHRFGELGNSLWGRLRRLKLRDDRLRIQQITQQEQAAFFAELQQTMQDARDNGVPPHALFFLHGFNVTFEEAAIRAAQIGFDLGAPLTAFFSWPSRGSVRMYTVDEASIEASERAITDFLIEFTAQCKADKIHVIAHSMGNRGLLRALQRIAANAETRGQVKFGQIFLAAPDVDRDLFLDLAQLYAEHSDRTTLYASGADLPVHVSSKLHDAPRAGYFKPYTIAPGMDTIAVPDFDLDLLGHAYFAQAEALLYDIGGLMRDDKAPPRQRLETVKYEGGTYWQLRR